MLHDYAVAIGVSCADVHVEAAGLVADYVGVVSALGGVSADFVYVATGVGGFI